MATVSSMYDGYSIHALTTTKIDEFTESFEEHMKWLEEVLIEAKNTFASKEIELLPKTPAVKRRRAKRKAAEVSSAEDSQTDDYVVEQKGGRAKRNKKSPGTKRVSAHIQLSATTEPQDCTTTTETETDTAASIETAQPTVPAPINPETSQDDKPTKKTRGKRAPPRTSKRTTRKTRSMSQQLKNVAAASTTDDSSQEEESAEISRSSRPKRGRKAKKDVKTDDDVKDSETDTRSSLESVSKKARPTRTAKKGTGKYVDHVKRLINVHEKLIHDNSSEDEFQSPKRRRTADVQQQQKDDGVLVPDTPEKDKAASPEKFFPAIANAEGQTEETVSPKSDTIQIEQSPSIIEVDSSSSAKSDQTETDDDDNDNASVLPVGANQEDKDKDQSPEKIAPVVQEEVVSPQKEAVVAAAVEEVAKDDSATESEAEEDMASKTAEDEDPSAKMEEDSLNIPEDSLDNISVANSSHSTTSRASSSRSTRSRASTRGSVRRSNRPSALCSKSKRRSSVRHSVRTITRVTRQSHLTAVTKEPAESSEDHTSSEEEIVKESVRRSNRPSVLVSKSKRKSSIVRQPSRTVTRQRVSRATSRRSSQQVSPIKMEVLDSQSEDEDIPVPVVDRTPESDYRQAAPIDTKTQTRRMTRSKIKQHSPSIQEVQKSSEVTSQSPEQFDDDSLEVESRPATRGSSRLRGGKKKSSNTSTDRYTPERRSPSPECPPEKVVKPHPSSFLNNLYKKKMPTTPSSLRGSSIVTSFIKRNTPVKKTLKEKQEEMKVQMQQKRKREEEIRKKVEGDKKKRIEEQKRRREERNRKVAEARELRLQQQKQKQKAMEAKYETKKVMSAQKQEEKRREELQRRRQMSKKKMECDERRRQEEETRLRKLKEQEDEARRLEDQLQRKREYEENERQQRIEEARRQQEERRLQLERQKQEMNQKKLEMDLVREREQRQLREEREREKQEIERKRFHEAEERERMIKAREEAEEERRLAADKALRERQKQQDQDQLNEIKQREKDRAEQERLKTNILKHNSSLMNSSSSVINTTITKETSPKSYEITPQRTKKPSTEEDYGIDDLGSDDSSDDEDAPRKIVPSWASGSNLKAALINQYHRPPANLDLLFPPITEAPDLTIIFANKKKARYLKRTSSAHWSSPIWKPGMF